MVNRETSKKSSKIIEPIQNCSVRVTRLEPELFKKYYAKILQLNKETSQEKQQPSSPLPYHLTPKPYQLDDLVFARGLSPAQQRDRDLIYYYPARIRDSQKQPYSHTKIYTVAYLNARSPKRPIEMMTNKCEFALGDMHTCADLIKASELKPDQPILFYSDDASNSDSSEKQHQHHQQQQQQAPRQQKKKLIAGVFVQYHTKVPYPVFVVERTDAHKNKRQYLYV